MALERTRTKTRVFVDRIFTVEQPDGTELNTFHHIRDTEDYLGINRTTIYQAINKDIVVKTKKVGQVKIKYKKVKTKIKETIVEPFVLSPARITNIPDLPGESWSTIPGFPECNLLSTKGRFKLVDALGNEAFGNRREVINANGRLYTEITLERPEATQLKCRLTRAMARTFLDNTFDISFKNDGRVVDHIDNDPRNNVIENLRICTSSENRLYGIYEQNSINLAKKLKPVVIIAEDGAETEFASLNGCARYLQANPGTVYASIRDKKTLKGYTIRYKEI